jgi:DNA-binding NtrC family response regulator
VSILVKAQTPTEQSPEASSWPSAKTVLVIEDEEALSSAVVKFLQRRSYVVFVAGDGDTGLDLFRANRSSIDVVLLDMTLPGISGSAVLSELHRVDPKLPVILTSAYSQEMASREFKSQDYWAFLRKPYRIQELLELLQRVRRPVSRTASG